MAVTIVGNAADTGVTPTMVPMIEAKQNWLDEWKVKQDWEFVSAKACAGGNDLGSCTIRRAYGYVKSPYNTTRETKKSEDVVGWWVRVFFVSAQGRVDVWTGRIAAETIEVGGAPTIPADKITPTGLQVWTAYEPLQELRKVFVSESYWWDTEADEGEEVKTIARAPSVNARDENGTRTGNRSAAVHAVHDGDDAPLTYLYGGTATWTRRQYLDYILEQWAFLTDGPEWRLTGQTDVLDESTDVIPMGRTQTIADILRMLINPRDGLDFLIRPFVDEEENDAGFEVVVYVLNAKDVGFEGAKLPCNPNVLRVDADDKRYGQVVVERTQAQRFDTIRIIGAPIVVCCSLSFRDESLVRGWTSEKQASYLAGTGTPGDGATLHDLARKAQEYSRVFAAFVTPDGWDLNNGMASPLLDSKGGLWSGMVGDYQRIERRTLTWLPLFDGFDYSTDPATDENPTGVVPDVLAPMVFVKDDTESWYILADQVGFTIQALQTELGVLVKGNPPHLLALTHWSGAADTANEPVYNFTDIEVTLAFDSDQRLQLEVTAADSVGDGSVLDIPAPDAECWIVAANTAYAADVEGGLMRTEGTRVLRNDSDRLYMRMAGAIARYHNDRARASIVNKGLVPAGSLLGSVLKVVEQGGQVDEPAAGEEIEPAESLEVQAVITQVSWQAEGNVPTTTIKTGFAQ